MSRRPSFRAARVAAVAALTVGWAFASATGLAVAAVGDPSPGASDTASDAADGAEPELVTFGVTGASGGVPDDRGFLAMTAAPGSVIYDSVAVLNQSGVPLDIDVYTGDAINADDGSIGLPARSVAPTAAGSWLALGASTVDVPAQSSSGWGYTIVPVTITIPADAEPGDHLAGVIASITSQGTATGEDQAATVNLEQRVGLRVYITVSGETHAGLTITDVRTTYHQADLLGLAVPGSATVTYTLTNTGNTRLNVRATSTASGVFGLGEASAAGVPIDDLLPRSSVTQTVELAGVWPTLLQKVTVAASVTAPLAGGDPGIGTPGATVWMRAVPWAYLAIILLLATGWWLRRRRRKASRRSRRAVGRSRHSHSNPGPTAPPVLVPSGKGAVSAQSRPFS